MPTKTETLLLFPTRVTRFELVGVAPEIQPLVLERSRSQPTVSRGERTGWQSGNDLFTWSAATRTLGKQIADAVMAAHDHPLDEIALFGWANVFTRGVFFNPHLHADAAWSGVYYLDAGDSGLASGGTLMLRDPRAGAGMVIGEANHHDSATCFEIVPRTGELWVFPAWLLHWVTPYQGDRPRISISFNAR